MKTLMLSWEFPPYITGGLGRHVAELAPALVSQGITVHLVTCHSQPEPMEERLHPNFTVHWVSVPPAQPGQNIYSRAQQVNQHLIAATQKLWLLLGGFDLIHAHDWLVGIAAVNLKQTFKCPIVATMHATEAGRWRNDVLVDRLSQSIDAVEKELSFEAWRVIACSHYMVTELQRHFHLPADKLDMIPNGINLRNKPRFPLDDLISLRAQFAAPKAPLIFSVGRLVYEKGVHILLGAMPQILSSFPDAKLVIAGKGPLLGYLQSIVNDLQIGDSVHFVGFVTDTERDKLFAIANCAVFPSLYEPFGIVALEAMAFNCPVIVSNLGGFSEVVDHEKTGLLIYPDNSDSTAWGIMQVLSRPAKAAEYAANAKQALQEKYSWQAIAAETAAVYSRVVAERAETVW